MFRKTIGAGLVSVGLLAAAAQANAAELSVSIDVVQTGRYAPGVELIDHRHWHEYHHVLSPREVRRILRREGFRHIEFLDRHGRTYTAYAEDYRGRPVIVRVSARSGQIISVRRAGYGHGGGYHDRPRCWLPEGCGY